VHYCLAMNAYPNGFWLYKCEPSHAAQILSRDARNDGESQFTINCIYAACDNKGKESELMDLIKGRITVKTKTKSEIELDEVLDEDFIW